MKKVVGLLLVGVIGSGLVVTGAGAGEKKNPATTPMNRDIARHKQFLEIAKKGGVEGLFLGDSITHGGEGQKAWKKYFEPLKAANFGIGGD